MMDEIYLFDTCAIIEIIKGNENYLKYSDRFCLTTKLNLFELYYNILMDLGEASAERFLKEYSKNVVEYDLDVIRNAAKFRILQRGKRLSMTDCIGYVLSCQLGVKFLTGDKEFKNQSNVEFVK